MAETGLKYLIEYIANLTGAKTVEAQNKKLTQSFTEVGASANKLGSVISTSSTAFLDNSKKAGTMVTTYRQGNNIIKEYATTLDGVSKVTKTTTTSMIGLQENLTRLFQRAILTIPLWLGLRAVVTSSIGTFTDAAKSFIDIDFALAQVKNELVDVGDVEGTLIRVRKAADELSTSLGISSAQTVLSFKTFKSAGLDVEEAMAGMTVASKTSVAAQEDIKDVTNSLISIYTLMGDRITGASDAQGKFEIIVGKILSSMPREVFTLTQFNEALKNFVGTANSSNLSLDEMIGLIGSAATVMSVGARGGTQLSSAFRQLLTNLDQVEKFLGRPIDRGNINQFTLLVDVLAKAQEKIKANTLGADLSEIFGNRGDIAVKGLSEELQRLLTNVQKISEVDTPGLANAQIDSRLSSVLDTVQKQLDRLKETRDSLGRNFLSGLVGGFDAEGGPEEFAQSITKINDALERAKSGMLTFGAVIKAVIDSRSVEINFLLDQFAQINNEIARQAVKFQTAKNEEKIINKFKEAGIKVDFFGGADKFAQQAASFNAQLRANQDPKNVRKLVANLFPLSTVPENKFSTLVPLIPHHSALQPGVEEKTSAQKKQQLDVDKDILSLHESLLEVGVNLNSESLKKIVNDKNSLEIIKAHVDHTKNLLDFNKKLTEEKKLQSRVGGNDLKLFDIAKTSGVDVARDIGNVLQGNTDFTSFLRRGASNDKVAKEIDILKTQFPDLFQNQLAQEFFKGNRISGFQDLAGGNRIPTDFKPTQITTNNNVFNIQTTDPNYLKNFIIRVVSNELPKAGSSINKAQSVSLTGVDGGGA